MSSINTKILFVCSGNVFRSMSAEYCLKKYCEINNINNISCSSAGIHENTKDKIAPEVKDELSKLDIDVSNHVPRLLTKDILDSNDLIVSMGINHKLFIKEKFGYNSFLFEEIVLGNKEPVLDNNESLDDFKPDSWKTEVFNRQLVRNIWEDISLFVKNYKKFI